MPSTTIYRIFLLLILLTSLIGYLSWGNQQSAFLYEVEIDILSKAIENPFDILHPMILLPIFGQGVLIFVLFRKKLNKKWIYVGIGSIGILMFFILFIGLLTRNMKIIASAIPFTFLSLLTLYKIRTAKF